MKRILYLDEVSEIAGGANSLTKLIANLDRQCFTPVVACPPGPLADRMQKIEVEHIPFIFRVQRFKTGAPSRPGRRRLRLLPLLQKLREGLEIAQLIRQYRIDLLHTNSLSPHIAGLVAARLSCIPIIWHIRVFWPRILYRTLLPDRLIFVSDAVRRRAFTGHPPSKAVVIYNGEDLFTFDPDTPHLINLRDVFGVSAEQPLAAIIGRLKFLKGHRELLHAWQHVIQKYPSAHLLVVGEQITAHGIGGAYRTELEQLASDLGVTGNVTFTGFRNDIPDILHTVDIVVSATQDDANPRSVLEAMAMRKAIVGMRSGGVPEMIIDGESGLLVANDDIPGLAAAIGRFIEDADLRESCGRAARQRALANFSIEHHAAKVQSIYSEVLMV